MKAASRLSQSCEFLMRGGERREGFGDDVGRNVLERRAVVVGVRHTTGESRRETGVVLSVAYEARRLLSLAVRQDMAVAAQSQASHKQHGQSTCARSSVCGGPVPVL